QVGVCTTSHVVCRPTRAEAEAYYQHYAVTHADTGALDHLTANRRANAGSHEDAAFTTYRMRFAAGGGTYPLVGSPSDIADEIVAMHAAGLAGTTLSFVNFLDELPYFVDTVLPLLKEAGVRL
ncbi:MAG: LLM class flavin-dependent oxidoreductase, partial [Pseudomonadota bacterium]